jgi:hypothetical protein
MLFIFTLYGSLSYRLRGHGYYNLPHSLRRLSVCLLPWLAVTLSVDWQTGLGVGLVSYLGIITGHGRYYSLGRGPYPNRADNWPGKLVGLCVADRYTKLFDALALALTGLAFTAPAAVIFAAYGHYQAAFILALAGILKPIPYEIGWRIHGKNGRDPNLYNELYYGALLGAGFGLCVT